MRGQKPTAAMSDELLVVGLKKGDEAAFRQIFARENAALLAFARNFVRESAAAEEAVQDTWVAVIGGIGRFEGRSTLRSWIFSVLANIARTKAKRDGRVLSFSDMGYNDPAVDPDRFSGDGTWLSPPGRWSEINPERILGGRQLLAHAMAVLEQLPPNQRAVVQLRDLEGLSAPDACEILGITESNQRILLHRGRSRIRAAIEVLMDTEKGEQFDPTK
ncbi:RNA polymerase sigma factor [Devosia rhodophyticola]|uniref:RNA polymerase sigma factor n=1 Tax=Devosia rhodophyticola TaxID=3026423 RepID=A0ABY7YY56_9HYPH|nr:RNA polymerase sigma factor [Devosia rhodophyticola]WDR06299.1 RNA polymerase sigma factor [Devosia rhodophyticola]